MNTQDPLVELDVKAGVARLWMNRPGLRNALDAGLIEALRQALEDLAQRPSVRVIVLGGRGSAFCAGADLNAMRAAATASPEDNLNDALRLAGLLQTLAQHPKPTIARLHGPVFAGGMGLASACDLAVAGPGARFCLSEVRLGLIPAMISPYVLRAMGAQAARRYLLTAEVFDAAEALRIGFVHLASASDTDLDATIDTLCDSLRAAGPEALTQAKRLIHDVAGRPIDDALAAETARRIASIRASAEGREGLAAFLEKRKPGWHPQA